MDEQKKKSTYSQAGVDIEAAKEAVEGFKARVAETFTGGVLSEIGHFGGMYSLAEARGLDEPVLISSSDGVGTKLMVAQMTGRHDTVGQCLVNHCVNDIMVQGAKPLFFMDYISVGCLRPEHISEVMTGFIRGCKENEIALLGGETAEMPGLYNEDDYDLAGFIVGLADRSRLVTGEKVQENHVLVGLPSTGLHTNGYSLARKIIFTDQRLSVSDSLPGGSGETIGEALLAVHRSYKRPLEALLAAGLLDAVAHITGGGLTDNLPRVFPKNLDARISLGTWPVPPIFDYLVKTGNVDEQERYQVFNMGLGMVLIVSRENLDETARILKGLGEEPRVIGSMAPGQGQVAFI
ncbi:MAG: phosphoribosylformylglycinamidine cyclo-ligase [Gemmatimonadota bacterium]|nr:phosphoribosylformylglycinamidine cyclo-ligase [Gemmatimonadota bacterium]